MHPNNGRNVLILSFGSSCALAMSISGVYPAIPQLAEHFNATTTESSLIFALFSLSGVFLGPPVGLLIDRFGRKAVLLPALILFCGAGTACGFVNDLKTLLFFRFLQGIGSCPMGILNTTMIADAFAGPRLHHYVGLNMAAFSMAAALSPTLGGCLAQVNWRLPFFLPALASFLVILAWKTPLMKPVAGKDFSVYLGGLLKVFTRRRTQALLGVNLGAWALAFGPIITGFPALAFKRFGASPAIIGFIMFFYALFMAITSWRLGALSRKFSARQLLLLGLSLQFMAFLCIPNLTGLAWMVIPIMFYGMGQGLNVPNAQSQLLQSVDASQRGSVMAVNSMMQRLGQVLGPVGFSTLIQSQGFDMCFYAAIGVIICMAYLILQYIPHEKGRER